MLRTVKLIAEPWDCGPGGYQVGGFPPGWGEWNDRYSDTVREFWKAGASVAEIAKRLTASGEIFNRLGRRPWCSINFVTAHDGFTLNDVVSYDEKHNEANGENNQDGSNDNRSWNCGVEGPTEDASINLLRERQVRNMLATLLLSQGTPMLLAGDEFRRTQQGNNNAYCQDNEISWINWELADEASSLVRFTRRLCELRHQYPILRRNRFLTGAVDAELDVKDLTWINATGDEMQSPDWIDPVAHCFGMLIDGRARPSGVPQRGTEATLLIVMNAYHDFVEFTLPTAGGGGRWKLLLDTNVTETIAGFEGKAGDPYGVTARSLVMFALVAPQ